MGLRADPDEIPCRDHRLPAVRGHLLELAGDVAGAPDGYRAAALLATNLPERDYLLLRAARASERVGEVGEDRGGDPSGGP